MEHRITQNPFCKICGHGFPICEAFNYVRACHKKKPMDIFISFLTLSFLFNNHINVCDLFYCNQDALQGVQWRGNMVCLLFLVFEAFYACLSVALVGANILKICFVKYCRQSKYFINLYVIKSVTVGSSERSYGVSPFCSL